MNNNNNICYCFLKKVKTIKEKSLFVRVFFSLVIPRNSQVRGEISQYGGGVN